MELLNLANHHRGDRYCEVMGIGVRATIHNWIGCPSIQSAEYLESFGWRVRGQAGNHK